MFSNAAHVQRDYDSAAQGVTIEKERLDSQLVALDVLFDKPDYLGKVNILGCPSK